MSASVLKNVTRLASTSAVGTAAASAGKHRIVVVGGGSAGLAVANQLYNNFKANGQELGKGDIAIIDPAKDHHFQPGWTLVGAGLKDKESMKRPLDTLIPSHISHIPQAVKGFNPTGNSVQLEGGENIGYDYLIVAAGISTNFDAVKGLTSALSSPFTSGVSTIYSYATADKTWDLIENLQSGKALFTQPAGPVKCAGAPQKICYMADDRWRLTGRKDKIQSEFITGMPVMFGVPHYSKVLNELRESKGIDATFNANLVEIKENDRVAVFQELTGEKKKIEKEFDLLHVTPPMGPLSFIKSSPLADAAGWVDVSSSTLQHTKFSNVFSLGDCSSLPTSKTAAAVTAQTPVLIENLTSLMENGKVGNASYDGYTSCPLFIGYGQLMLAEFKYGGIPKETFGAVWDQRKPTRAFYHLGKDVFPYAYFNHMVKGNWYGPKGLVPPQYQVSVPSVVPS